MKMKSVLLAAAVGAMAVSTSAMAAGEFEGWWAGAGMGFRGQSTTVYANNFSVDGIGKANMFGMLQGGYAMRYGDWNLGPYAFYLPGITSSDTFSPGANGYTAQFKWKNQWGIGLQPGYYLAPNTILYAKVSYNSTKAELDVSNPGAQEFSDHFNGPGIGLGMKHELSNNVLIWVDVQQQFYSSNTYTYGGHSVEVKPKMTMGTFGVGYQF